MEYTLLQIVVVSALVLINLATFLIMGYDKRKATLGENQSRLSEGLLFFMAAAFGSIGVFVAMRIFRHKTRIWYFQIGIPLLVVQNLSVAYLVIQNFSL